MSVIAGRDSGMKWGVAGYGDVVRRRVMPALQSLSQPVTCLWGRDPVRGQAVAKQHGVGSATSEFASMLRLVDVVYIATPVATHIPFASDAIRAGCHVLIEKPLSGALPDGIAELEEQAAQSDLCVGVAYYRRLAPALVWLREVVCGLSVLRFTINFGSLFDPAPDDPMYWRTVPALAGGGVLADAGSHRIDLLCWLLGEPVTVSADIAQRFDGKTERRARLWLGWATGATADIALDWSADIPHDRLEVTFDGGYLFIEPLDSGYVRGIIDGVPIDKHMPPSANPHVPLITDFIGAVAARVDPVCPLAEALVVDRVIAKASGR